ncbi:uncharacterized protein LOC114272477 isoform X1 [Camellia sinensis]|uniref:uncharacterized protein LOC114272477 isoform X1 n=2 Tax=Camellia sinensis TaxID=4442 RepID=UPI001036E07E|nr:uncharacterized protein LOC114272477 isoform X1 [Camellia sinensis]
MSLQLQSPLTQPHRTLAILHIRPFQLREYRVWRRPRRFKPNPIFLVRTQLGPSPSPSPFDNLFQNLVSHFPSINSLDLIAPALGFASGVSLYLSRFNSNPIPRLSDIGEWILFTSPTPFNRFVILRCPSISFELEDVNEKLVKEDRHFVRLNSGRIRVWDSDEEEEEAEEKLVYQRVCVSSDDGGVISLDWPANLDLAEERGLDTTLLLVPGTADGSMDKNIRWFVCESLKRGCFPVVMNPRGCAGSPLTTARLFTAADSDDICTAIQFINKARPWTTLMGVGWGYGANMLTKYLAEVGERTPLTAATCIDNPFDLEEATRSSHHIVLDQKLTGGLIDILQSNKGLFQGRAKGFDVEKALLATSVRDFEKAISMVSYGFDAIEDFYAKSSTRGVVGNVKIPVLFIQNDDGTVPLFSIPRSLIAENPFTSLLLCSCSPSRVIASERSAISWYQHLTIEWLAAVELGLLKGRHPLLKDVNVTLNPSKGLAWVEGTASDKSGRVNKLLNLSQSNVLNGYSSYPSEERLGESDISASISSRFRHDSQRNPEIEDRGLQQKSNGTLEQASSVDAVLVKEEGNPTDDERGQVLQTAQVAMNMLDVTMPGTLTEEQKQKVLMAVGQGETVVKALQDAVPEDVRGKLTAAVSEILHNQGTNFKLDGFLNINRIPNVASGLKSKIQENVELSSGGGYEDPHSSDLSNRVDDLTDSSNDNQVSVDRPAGGLESELQTSETLQKTTDSGHFQSNTQGGDISSSGNKDTVEWEKDQENVDMSRERAAQYPDSNENGSETVAKPNFPSQSERPGGSEDATVDLHIVNQNGGLAKFERKEENNIQENVEKVTNSSTDQNNMSSNMTEEGLSHPVPSSEAQPMESEGDAQPMESKGDAQPMESEGNDDQKREENSTHSVLNQNSSDSPTFSVSQAFSTLTGIDDSTQVAVNSVFGAIEDMITQMEEEKDNETKVDKDNETKVDDKKDNETKVDKKEVEDRRIGSIPENHQVINDYNSTRKEENKNDQSSESDMVDDLPSYDRTVSHNDARTRWPDKERLIGSPDPFNGESKEENGTKELLVSSNLLAKNSNIRHLYNVPLFITTNPYGDSLYKEFLRKYLLSKMPNTKSLDLDTTTALFLDYFPEEDQWKLLELSGNNEDSASDVATHEGANKDIQAHSPSKSDTDEFIEPPYVIMDAEKQEEPVQDQEYEKVGNSNQKLVIGNETSDSEVMSFVKNIVLDSLKVEVGRRLSTDNTKEIEPNLARDMEEISKVVSLAAGHGKDHTWFLDGKDNHLEKIGTLHGEHIIKAIYLAVQETNYLRRVLPVGVVVGSCLAALRKNFNVETVNGNSQSEAMALDQINHSVERNGARLFETEADRLLRNKINLNYNLSRSRDGKKDELKKLNNGSVMIGVVTAALGASALLVHQQDSAKVNETSKSLSKSLEEKGNHQKKPDKLEEEISEKNQNGIVTSLAEKAMSVAGPVVPMKEDGEVDHDRLVAMLTELAQKGGMLRMVGKFALLWGGMRGAMSLTDRLISFLRIAERPLFQRILGFVFMVLVLWSPIVVPLLPTLVRSWVMHDSSKMAELVCIVGLYASIMILLMLWGKRIRGYENPIEQYGLDFTSLSKIRNFFMGLIGGVMLVLSIHSLNVLLGCVRLSWPSTFISFSLDDMTWLKGFGKMLLLLVRGIVTATGVSLVEELLFRSWLPDEIATDLGYYRGIIISGLAFSLSQRSPWAVPGLWLLSLGLAGARQRNHGSLSIPIGLRSGIMASSFILQMGGFLTYQPNFPQWATGTHPFQPFSGVAGLAFALIFAIVLYPRQPLHQQKKTREIQE